MSEAAHSPGSWLRRRIDEAVAKAVEGGVDPEEAVQSALAAIDDVLPRFVVKLYEDAPHTLKERRTFARAFERRLQRRWKKGLDLSEMLLIAATEAAGGIEPVRRRPGTADAEVGGGLIAGREGAEIDHEWRGTGTIHDEVGEAERYECTLCGQHKIRGLVTRAAEWDKTRG